MKEKEHRSFKERFVLVKDRQGNEYVCRADALRNPNELSEEEKAACYDAPPFGPS